MTFSPEGLANQPLQVVARGHLCRLLQFSWKGREAEMGVGKPERAIYKSHSVAQSRLSENPL